MVLFQWDVAQVCVGHLVNFVFQNQAWCFLVLLETHVAYWVKIRTACKQRRNLAHIIGKQLLQRWLSKSRIALVFSNAHSRVVTPHSIHVIWMCEVPQMQKHYNHCFGMSSLSGSACFVANLSFLRNMNFMYFSSLLCFFFLATTFRIFLLLARDACWLLLHLVIAPPVGTGKKFKATFCEAMNTWPMPVFCWPFWKAHSDV